MARHCGSRSGTVGERQELWEKSRYCGRRAGAVGEEQILWEKSRNCGSGPCPRLIFEVAVLFAGMARSNKREPKIIRGIVRYLQLDNPLSITFCTDT